MRLLVVVQRYGVEVAGGAEAAARMLCEAMSAAGHHVSVITSCAVDYSTWADSYGPGTSVLNDVAVTRLPVVSVRDPEQFNRVSERLFGSRRPSATLQREWMTLQGPILSGFRQELLARVRDVDVVSFMTYLYPTTVLGLPFVAPHVPTVLHPTAHDERPFRLPIIRDAIEHALRSGVLQPRGTGAGRTSPSPHGARRCDSARLRCTRRRRRPAAGSRPIRIGRQPLPPLPGQDRSEQGRR